MKKSRNLGPLAWAIFTLIFIFGTTSLKAQQKRNHDNFNRIDFSISGDIHITQGNSYSVKLEGSESDLEKVITKVENSRLIIKTENHSNLKDKVVVYVTLPKLTALNLAGSGNAYAKEGIKGDELDLSISGSGDISFNKIQVNELEASIAGSGDIVVSGKTDKLEASIAGSGDISAIELEAQKVEVDIAGSGSAKVYAIDKLETNIVGSGSVRYKGNPLIDANTIGSGSTRSL